jgi:hypothetical protein
MSINHENLVRFVVEGVLRSLPQSMPDIMRRMNQHYENHRSMGKSIV